MKSSCFLERESELAREGERWAASNRPWCGIDNRVVLKEQIGRVK